MLDTPKRAYLAGPMTGRKLYNWPAFEWAAAKYRSIGWDIVSPTEMDEARGDVEVVRFKNGKVKSVTTLPTFDYAAVLADDLRVIETVDAIILLPDWHLSSGARTELAHALGLGKEVHIV